MSVRTAIPVCKDQLEGAHTFASQTGDWNTLDSTVQIIHDPRNGQALRVRGYAVLLGSLPLGACDGGLTSVRGSASESCQQCTQIVGCHWYVSSKAQVARLTHGVGDADGERGRDRERRIVKVDDFLWRLRQHMVTCHKLIQPRSNQPEKNPAHPRSNHPPNLPNLNPTEPNATDPNPSQPEPEP